MGLVLFEGWETCGDEIGSGSAATVRPNIDLRADVLLSSDVWLVDNHDSTGFALNIGTGFAQEIDLPVADEFQYPTGAGGPIATFGCRFHNPDNTLDYQLIALVVDGSPGGEESVNINIENGTDIEIRHGATVLDTVLGAVTQGAWHYVEVSVRIDGGSGRRGEAVVSSQPEEGDFDLDIADFVGWREIYDFGGYLSGDEIRYKGQAYTASQNVPTDTPPPNATYWDDDGSEDDPSNQPTQAQSGSTFYTSNDPDFTSRSATSPSGDPTNNLGFFPAYGVGDYLPGAGEKVWIGGNPSVEVRLDGTKIMESYQINLGLTRVKTWKLIRFEAQSWTDTGEDFAAMDDIYLVDDNVGHAGFLGEVSIISLPPTGDTETDWTPSTAVDHYTLIDENGAEASDYVDAGSNGLVDRFTHTDSSAQFVYAVKIEAEAFNTTSGSPTLEVSMGSAGEISEVFTVDDTVDYTVFEIISESPPGGGIWMDSDIDSLESGIESAGF